MLQFIAACQPHAITSHTHLTILSSDHWQLVAGLEAIGIVVILSYALSVRTILPRSKTQETDSGTRLDTIQRLVVSDLGGFVDNSDNHK